MLVDFCGSCTFELTLCCCCIHVPGTAEATMIGYSYNLLLRPYYMFLLFTPEPSRAERNQPQPRQQQQQQTQIHHSKHSRWGSTSRPSKAFPQACPPERPTSSSATTACARCTGLKRSRLSPPSLWRTIWCAARRTLHRWRLSRVWRRCRWKAILSVERPTTGLTWFRFLRRACGLWTGER